MYWWIGSAMSPRPWYVLAAPFMGTILPRRGPEHGVTVHGLDGDRLRDVAAPDADRHRISRATLPEPRVELLLRADGRAVDLEDLVVLPESGRPGRPVRREAGHQDPAVRHGGVEPEPRARRTAHPPQADQIVFPRHELLHRDHQVLLGLAAEAK